MANGLSVNRIVNVNVNLQKNGAGRRNFGMPLIIGSSDVIPISERIATYTTIDAIAQDFGIESNEYKAAVLYFGQAPRPQYLKIGRWIETASPAHLIGARVESALELLTAITDGSFKITVDGDEKTITGLDFHLNSSFFAIANVISQAGEANNFVCKFDETNHRFIIATSDTGSETTISFAKSGTSGTDVSSLLFLTENQGAKVEAGLDAETATECVVKMLDLSNDWYFLMFAKTLENSENISIAQLIEASTVTRTYFYTTQDPKCLDYSDETNIGYLLKSMNLSRTCGVYSSKSAVAAASFIGRAATVNFNGNNTVITMKFKRMVSVPYEELSETAANALNKFNLNVYVLYNNETAIIQEGVMANGFFFDEIFGLDWFQNGLETSYYNILYSSNKVPQTDSGMTLLIAACERIADEAVANGLVAPGTWNGDSFGQLRTGDYLAKGYYFYADSFNNQDQSLRERRQAMPIQGAVKLAGAVHFGDVVINVNR